MFSALKKVDGSSRQRFGRLSPALACKMCQFQADCWIFIEQNHGLRKGRGKKTKIRIRNMLYGIIYVGAVVVDEWGRISKREKQYVFSPREDV